MIDSTFGTPINQHPAEYGIDLVMHSGTKYLSGHADLTCGVVAGRRELIEQINDTRTTLGNCMDPHASWLLIRGLKTLAVRVERQNDNALRVAEFLAQHGKVRRVHYPFLKSHPQYAVAREQMSGGGGMVTFEVEGSGRGCAAGERGHAPVYAGDQPGRRRVAGIDSSINVSRHDSSRSSRQDGRD